jgi:hypothetical protein
MPDPTNVVRLDPAAAYPAVTAVRAALTAGDWGGVRRVLDAAMPVGRSMLIRFGSDGDDLEDHLRSVIADDPADTAAVAMLGSHLINIGWNIRSGARAPHVSEKQFAGFHDWLRRAEIVLLDGVARRPDDPALWVARLTSARGLELGLAEIRRRYDKLAAIDPHHLPGQSQYLQRLCPKWGGSYELLHAWCREAMLAAPPGAMQAGLVVDAHIEHWLEEGAAGPSYLRSKAVRAEIYEAANRSVWHPEFRRDYGWVQVASSFAMVFGVLDDLPSAARMFGLLGDLGTQLPWVYLDENPAAAIRARRRKARADGEDGG